MKNYRIRKLIDGRYVAEVRTGWWIFSKWRAVDIHGYLPNSHEYITKFCIFHTESRAKRALGSALISE